MDCRWSSPVRAIHGTVSAVDAVNRNVLEFAILTKNGKNRPTEILMVPLIIWRPLEHQL